jgi:seryl-tRNA synthetase
MAMNSAICIEGSGSEEMRKAEKAKTEAEKAAAEATAKKDESSSESSSEDEAYEDKKARLEKNIENTKRKRARMETMPDGDEKTALATKIATEEAEDKESRTELEKMKAKMEPPTTAPTTAPTSASSSGAVTDKPKVPKAPFPEAGEVPGRGGGGWDLNQNAKIMTNNSAQTPWEVGSWALGGPGR